WKGWAISHRQKQKKLIMLPSETMIWQPEFTDKTLSRKPGAVQYTLNNGGAFMAPEPDDDDDETWVLFNAMNGNRAEMSPEAAGIAACLMTYSHHACRTENYAMTVHYYRLRDYALQHPECSAIMRIID
ncbi:antirestriction protein, partial [Escherichia coli]